MNRSGGECGFDWRLIGFHTTYLNASQQSKIIGNNNNTKIVKYASIPVNANSFFVANVAFTLKEQQAERDP